MRVGLEIEWEVLEENRLRGKMVDNRSWDETANEHSWGIGIGGSTVDWC
jgi:hypothetical protein